MLVAKFIVGLPHGAARGIGGVVLFGDLPGFLGNAAGEFRCFLARLGIGGGLLCDVINKLAEDGHRCRLTNMSHFFQADSACLAEGQKRLGTFGTFETHIGEIWRHV